MKKIAVIGAGIAGLWAAHRLQSLYEVDVFEKARGVSGRMSTRYSDAFEFDHGAQYFTASSPAFRDFVRSLEEKGIVSPWQGRFGSLNELGFTPVPPDRPRYVAKPRMNEICKFLAKDCSVHIKVRMVKIEEQPSGQYLLHDEAGEVWGAYDHVVSAVPYEQFSELFSAYLKNDEDLKSVKIDGCFSLMIGDENITSPDFDGAMVEENPIGWIAVNSKKNNRKSIPCFVVQTTNEWAEEHMERPAEWVTDVMLQKLERLLGFDYRHAVYLSLHRWRYAKVKNAYGKAFWQSEDQKLFAIGDWCLGPKVEKAFLSADSLADHLMKAS